MQKTSAQIAWALVRYATWEFVRELGELVTSGAARRAARAYFDVTDQMVVRAYDQAGKPQEREP